ncbi:MAG: hypothetical protein AABY04_01595 [Candidatus Micrarchaeota archaeon]
MNIPVLLAFMVFFGVFAGNYFLNFDFEKGKAKEGAFTFTPPYYYAPNEWVSQVNAFFFVFLFSLLFFGYSAPIATGIEGAKYAAILLAGTGSFFDFAFIVPELLAVYSATLLGQGVLNDFEGQTVFEHWGKALKVFGIAFCMLAILIVARFFVV